MVPDSESTAPGSCDVFAWFISRIFSANEHYFSLTINQPIVLSAMAYQPSEHGIYFILQCLRSVTHTPLETYFMAISILATSRINIFKSLVFPPNLKFLSRSEIIEGPGSSGASRNVYSTENHSNCQQKQSRLYKYSPCSLMLKFGLC